MVALIIGVLATGVLWAALYTAIMYNASHPVRK